MFYEGDLQSGISLAIQQAKSVVCFVRDTSEESTTWEHEWLCDEPIATILANKTVTLRLEAGSQEAGFLSAFCPIAKTPVLVVIHNGQLKLCLVGGISHEDFVSRLSGVLGAGVANQNSRPDETATTETRAETSQDTIPSIQPEPSVAPSEEPVIQATTEPTQAEDTPATSTQPAEAPERSPSTDYESLFPDRATRLEADHQLAREAEAAEAAARAAKAAGKRKAVDVEIASSGSKDPKQLSYAAQEKMRKQAQQTELNRILQRVEADKRERKEREELRKKQREAELREFSGAEFAASPSPPAEQSAKRGSVSSISRGPAAKSGDVCLRIRLLDGSQIREYFPPSATLAADVRPRVDWALSSGPSSSSSSSSSSKPPPAPPYSFKHVLAPLPNRTLGPSDEAKPLGELPDVVPSATLVLVPAKNAVTAYTGVGNGYIGSIYVAMLQMYNLFTTFLATFFAPFGRGGGGGGGGAAAAGGQEGGAGGSGGAGDGQGQGKSSGRGEGGSESGIRIRTLRDQGETGNEYYNGNSLDFEPKKEYSEDEGK
ncbi:UBX domain-containing protein [Botryosphaeria dothidea]|uniref:UBX domain-containing protein 2 n=1 Tax=Botryosphaeria dothidea TaxID=55169 RepID=A0A8H4IYK5_9PEZI|nr:UBX domain-containing protein [Botryosphaeria dothidea]